MAHDRGEDMEMFIYEKRVRVKCSFMRKDIL